MFPKNRRIPRKMFPLLDKRQTHKRGLFLLKFAFKNGVGCQPTQQIRAPQASRFCFSVSNKISKSAVIRNRMRRIGYKLLKKYLPQIKPDAIILFSFMAVPKNKEDIDKNIEFILKKSKLTK